MTLIKDGSNAINRYLYVGPRRVSERKYVKASDGSTEVTTLHAMYDGVAAITRWYHDKSDNSVVAGFQYGRDKVGNPNYELREHQSSYGDEYTYDNLYRLTRTVYDDTTPTSPTVSPSAATTDDFDYDDIGNRETAYLKSANATTYLANPVNECTKSTLSGTDSLYDSDAAGNLTRIAAAAGSDTDGDWRFHYDYENTLTKAEKYVTDTWVTQGEYVRDANGRRVEKVADGTTIRYYYDGMRAIEETEGTGSPTVERQYVFGNGIDEALVMYDENGGGYDAYYYLADPLWTVEALVDESADIVEAYAYRAYGEPTIKTADGGDGDWFDGDETTTTNSAYGNTITFTGRQYDPETAFYYYRARMYDPIRGRFINRDPVGYKDGMNLYHGYFVPDKVDPSGLASCSSEGCSDDDSELAWEDVAELELKTLNLVQEMELDKGCPITLKGAFKGCSKEVANTAKAKFWEEFQKHNPEDVNAAIQAAESALEASKQVLTLAGYEVCLAPMTLPIENAKYVVTVGMAAYKGGSALFNKHNNCLLCLCGMDTEIGKAEDDNLPYVKWATKNSVCSMKTKDGTAWGKYLWTVDEFGKPIRCSDYVQ